MISVSRKTVAICILLMLGVSLRLVVASLGFTFDMDSYNIVGKIIHSGGNVYKETTRYNYGPLWFILLGIVYRISRLFTEQFLFFRFILTIFLTLVDIGIWYFLYKKFSYLASFIFFLNPISIVLTGYYSQFDNLALFLGLISVFLYEKSSKDKIDGYFISSLLLLGLSLITKHIFFAFPLWIALGEKKWNKRLLILSIPLGMFVISFIPYVKEGFLGIKNNVFLYASSNNAPLWQFLVPDYLKRILRKQFLFFGSLIIGAVVFRNKSPHKQLLFYTGILVTFSYAIADQYFAIVIPFIAIYFNLFFVGFVIIQTFFLFMVLQGGETALLGFLFERSTFGYTTQILLLFIGILFFLYRLYFPRFRFVHVLYLLIFLNIILYGGIIVPSIRENRRMAPIILAIERGDYEKANSLYHEIEINPPFAGSRFYDKLTGIRYEIEFYRTYRYAWDGYIDKTLPRDWKKIRKDLQFVPKNFPEKSNILLLINYADSQI